MKLAYCFALLVFTTGSPAQNSPKSGELKLDNGGAIFTLTEPSKQINTITTCPELVEVMGGLPECKPSTPKGKVCINYGPKPEPIDVPAIGVIDDLSPVGMCDKDQTPDLPAFDACRKPRFTCTDKSRILLTAEDGTKHCVKFDFASGTGTVTSAR